LSARSRAEARLSRPVPDFAGWESREPAHRVAGRDRPLPDPRPAPGDELHVHTDAVRELKLRDPGRPAPNAPLLMRVVRTPFALDPVKVAKVRLIEPYEPPPREKLGRPGEAWREAMTSLHEPGPMRAIAHRPEPRPRPFRRREGQSPSPRPHPDIGSEAVTG
jgi:hypothetical protein